MAHEGNGSAAWKGLVVSIISRNNYSVFMSSATEIYRIKETYERFNQRMEMFCRSIWDQEFAETLEVPNYVKALLGRAVESGVA